MNGEADIEFWKQGLAEEISRSPGWVDRVEMLEECVSTQDEAARLAGGRSGLAVYALRQTGGRGRLGRAWEQRGELGVAVTFTVGTGEISLSRVSLAAGLAALNAGECLIGSGRLGLRWPNDVVERPARQNFGGPFRKVAGVLVEQRDGLFLVGIGINVLQEASDFGPDLSDRATSLKLLSSENDIDCFRAAVFLLREFSSAISLSSGQLTQAVRERDVLIGTTQVLVHDGRRYSGVVESIEPTAEIVLRIGPESIVRLPALTTSLVHDA